jgi:hypothetical protein
LFYWFFSRPYADPFQILPDTAVMRIWCFFDPWFRDRSGLEKLGSGIRDKHPESEKLGYGTDVDYGIGNNWKPYSDEKAGLFIYAFYSCSGSSWLVHGQIWT